VLDIEKDTEVKNVFEIARGSIGRAFDRAEAKISIKSKKIFLDKRIKKLLIHECILTDNEGKGITNLDYGRYVPTSVVLDGHKRVSESFPGFVSSGRYSVIELYDTTTAIPLKVCHIEGKDLRIDNFNKFIEFIQKRYINVKAYSADKVYNEELMYNSRLKSEYVAASVAEYLKVGMRINYGDYMSWDKGLISRNLKGTLGELNEDMREENIAKSVFEALVIDVLGRYNFKEVSPVKLQEQEGIKEISIFSNEIEVYLNRGAVFRFLKCVNRVILKEKGIELGENGLEQVSKDVLMMIINKELPREEERLVRYLPGLIDLVRYKASVNKT